MEQTLNSIISALANFFNITTQAVIENIPMWLAKYGWYVTVKGIWFDVLLGSLIGVILGVGIVALDGIIHDTYNPSKKTLGIAICVLILAIVITVAVSLIPCWIAPEFVGLEAVIKLIKSSAG